MTLPLTRDRDYAWHEAAHWAKFAQDYTERRQSSAGDGAVFLLCHEAHVWAVMWLLHALCGEEVGW